MRFWPEQKYSEEWMYKKVRLAAGIPEMAAGSKGVVVGWRNGWPQVLFSSKIDETPVDVIELTKDREGTWLSVRLDDLEKI
jgi:hypothetical protein